MRRERFRKQGGFFLPTLETIDDALIHAIAPHWLPQRAAAIFIPADVTDIDEDEGDCEEQRTDEHVRFGSYAWPHDYIYDELTGSDNLTTRMRADVGLHPEQAAIIELEQSDLSGHEMVIVEKSADRKKQIPTGAPSCPECSKFILYTQIDCVWLWHTSGWRRYTAARYHALSLQNAI